MSHAQSILILDKYANSAFRNQWGLVVGAIVCGLTSGLFWVSEGAIVGVFNVLSPGTGTRLNPVVS
jgi:hypothetical protein